MRVLVVGSGGREHALCWKLAQEAEVHCAPGNPGIAEVAECHPVKASDFDKLSELSKTIAPDLVVVGPEQPLIDGLGNWLRRESHAVFGPDSDGAKLEGSKAFSKELMLESGVPTPRSWTECNPTQALEHANILLRDGGKAVIKASGPALGKGVYICEEEDQAREVIHRLMIDKEIGESGETVVIEEFIDGKEFSILTLVNGKEFLSLPIAQDYKRIFDNDQGPNTGGMGSYSPVRRVTSDLLQKTETAIVERIVNGLAGRKIDYRGVIFSGIMSDDLNPNCLEYNVRFGDPETQSIMPRLGEGFAEALLACAKGEPIPAIEVNDNAVVTVVLASEGYPGPVQSGKAIEIDTSVTEGIQLFHAGTSEKDGQLVTAGGRVLSVTATAGTLPEARRKAYRAVKGIRFEGMQFRTDIAYAWAG